MGETLARFDAITLYGTGVAFLGLNGLNGLNVQQQYGEMCMHEKNKQSHVCCIVRLAESRAWLTFLGRV